MPETKVKRCWFCYATDVELRGSAYRHGTDEVLQWKCADKAACEARPTYKVPFQAIRLDT
jgi:hypothetical protein